MESIASIDRALTLAINSLHSTLTDSIWMFFSNREVWIPLYVAVVVALFMRLGWKKATCAVIGLALTIVACDQTANILKFGVARLRPCHDAWMLERGLRILEDPGGLYGFFSAHAANAFGFALCSSVIFNARSTKASVNYGRVIILWAFLVGASRVFVGKHFFGDVLVGAAIGIAFGWIFGKLSCVIGRYIESGRLGSCRRAGDSTF